MNQVTSVAMVTDHHIESGIGYYGLELARCMQPYAATLLYKPFQPNKQDAALHQSLPWLRKIPYRSFKELRPYIFPAFTHFALQNSDASLYHAHWFMAGLGAMTLRKKPVLVTMHDVSLLHIPEFSPQFIRFYRWALQQFKKAQLPILVVSHQAKSDAIHYAHYPEALVHVVYNGINHERFQPQPHASGPTARFRFVYAGGLGQRKNVGLLLEAFRQVSRQYPEAELHIAGGFPEHTPTRPWHRH
jgi:glycosyltransferase involved in cell wall biosynthesis